MPSVAVVVLNWNGASDTIECLRSLRTSVLPLYVVVVDNGSTDGSVQEIAASGLADVVLETGENLGYAEGNNVGLRLAIERGFPVVAVLNNDTVTQASSFSSLTEHLADDEDRALSPDIRYFDEPSRSWFEGGILDNGWPRHLQPNEIRDDVGPLRASDFLSGCCVVARLETWKRVGLFDPRYFLIFEDSDWSLRATKAGVKLFVVTDSVIKHRVSQSFASGPSSLLGDFYFVRNGLTFEATYARGRLPAFALRWVVRPTLSTIARQKGWRSIVFRWAGAFAFLLHVRGRAPVVVEQLAGRLARAEHPLSSPRTDDS